MNAPHVEEFLTLQEIVAAARRNLQPGPWSYLVGGAETETTVRRNRQALDSLAFRPRVLRDVSRIDSRSAFFGRPARLPLLLAPIGGLESLVEGGAAAAEELPTFGGHACYNVYRTRDGEHVALGALEPKFWRAFTTAVGRPDLTARHLSGEDDQRALIDEVRGIFAGKTREEWLALLERHDLCLTPVNQPADALVDPHITARGTVVHAPGLRAIRPPFADTTPDLSPAPALGAHTSDILNSSPTGAATEESD